MRTASSVHVQRKPDPALNKKEKLHGMKWIWSGGHGYLKTTGNEKQFPKSAAGVAFKGSIIVRRWNNCARQLHFYHWIWRVPITTHSTWQEWGETASMPSKPLGSSNFSASLSWLHLGKEKMGPATEPLIYTLFWIGEFVLLLYMSMFYRLYVYEACKHAHTSLSFSLSFGV